MANIITCSADVIVSATNAEAPDVGNPCGPTPDGVESSSSVTLLDCREK